MDIFLLAERMGKCQRCLFVKKWQVDEQSIDTRELF